MKKIKTIFPIFFLVLFYGCTEVVNVDLKTDQPKLVIEANINWQKGTTGANQKIILTTTTDYYTNIIPKVSNALVSIKNSTNTTFNFIENPGTGEYICTNFIPKLNEEYSLTIEVNGNIYKATEKMFPVASIINAVQVNDFGLSADKPRVRFFYLDPANEKNFYLYKMIYSSRLKPAVYSSDDLLYNGNTFFSGTFTDNLKPGDKIDVVHYGISERFFKYIDKLSGNTAPAGTFGTPPVLLRGNIINVNDKNNFPFGYFSLSETDAISYTIQ